MTDHRTRCPDHFHRTPCPMCVADCKAGEHATPVPTCPRCSAAPEPVTDAKAAASGERED